MDLGVETSGDALSQAIGDELEHIIASSPFRSSPRLCAFLRFVVEMTLAGRTDRIKGYTIGVEALGRDASFDPQTDPIVRVEAGRLRSALARYYAGAGSNDRVVIELPRGGYVPTFRTPHADAVRQPRQRSTVARGHWDDATLAAALDGLIEVRQQQMEAINTEVETARRILGLMRELLGAIGADVGRVAQPRPDATSAGEPARGPHRSEIPPHSPCRRCPDRQP